MRSSQLTGDSAEPRLLAARCNALMFVDLLALTWDTPNDKSGGDGPSG